MEKNIDTKIYSKEEEKIITPKARRLFPSLQINRNYSSSIKVQKTPKTQSMICLDNISLEEINKDFLRFSQKIDEEKGQNELMKILCNSMKEPFDSNNHKGIFIERPKNDFEKNFIFDENNNNDYYSKLIDDTIKIVNLGK